ncbi:addiction module toxin, RelE/StbE family [Pectobacterium carotovorum subsp. carotovorum PCC21]|nr:addiction module toxin, RelE/StbE family [Pectobacterium carotovorum subsp. carotovorum PCC21]
MSYSVKFREDALKEWLKLDKTIQQQFAKKTKKMLRKSPYSFGKVTGDEGLLQNKAPSVRLSFGL